MHWFDKQYICEYVGEPARLEQLAEESTEVAQAALKLARVLRDENPTSTTEEKARKSLEEEFSDLSLIAETLNLNPDKEYVDKKILRWVTRLNDKHKDTYKMSIDNIVKQSILNLESIEEYDNDMVSQTTNQIAAEQIEEKSILQ